MMNQRETLKTSWVYALRKDDLVSYLSQCAQDPTGTVEEMRRRLAKFVATDHDEKVNEKLRAWQRIHEQCDPSSVSLTAPVGENNGRRPSISEEKSPNSEPKPKGTIENHTPDDRIATIELVRKWGLKYDGGKEVLKFIDRLEELAGMYSINLTDIIPVMFEILRDKALVWFRNNRKAWEHWHQFKKDFLGFFLPPRYFEKLEDDIRGEAQENDKEDLIPPTRVTHISLSQPKESPIPSPPPWHTRSIDEVLPVEQLPTEIRQVLNESPIPSPPLLNTRLMDEMLAIDQLPMELQHVIARKKAKHHGERTRFILNIDGMKYRVTIIRNGTVRVTLADSR